MLTEVDKYIANEPQWSVELTDLRDLMLSLGMTETLKWSRPVYTWKGKNVLSISGFKHHYGVWFFNGVFLKDAAGVLEKAQDETKAMRHIRYTADIQPDLDLLRAYVQEAMQNEEKGLKVEAAKPGKYEMSEELKAELDQNSDLHKAFYALSPGKQKEYSNHILSAKQEKTKISRLGKIKPMILSGVGLHDKYKNC